jgi:hypothetical protein
MLSTKSTQRGNIPIIITDERHFRDAKDGIPDLEWKIKNNFTIKK